MRDNLVGRIWADIRSGHNLDVYFTVVICLVVAIFGIVGVVDLLVVTSAILAVLSLQAVSLLGNRQIEKGLRESLASLSTQRQLSEIFEPWGKRVLERKDLLTQADEVWILSRTCRKLWVDYQDELQSVAKRDGLRLLFLDPNNGVLKMVAKSAVWQQPEVMAIG